MANKPIYNYEEGDGKNKKLLGGKGAGLCQMTQIGLPVPPGFTITTEVCKAYYTEGKKLPAGFMDEVRKYMNYIETKSGRKFGEAANPLLVSVRSGAAMSMPGMMDTILNLGLNDKTVVGIASQTGNERFAWDSYRRFLSLFGKIALGVDEELYSKAMDAVKAKKGVKLDTDLASEDLKVIAEQFKAITEKATGKPFDQDPFVQLQTAIEAVFGSWMGRRAVDYRREFKITPEQADGTAVSVVAMVFGNMGNDSATGVAFTRDPGTGENVFFGEYLTNAQGEDVVAGIRTPKTIREMATDSDLPGTYKQLEDIRARLEGFYKEVQDFEFTIEKGKLYMLQTRNGKMNAQATVRTSVEMVAQGIINKEQALLRLKPDMLDQLLHKMIDPAWKGKSLAKGLNASPGAAVGSVVFDADEAVTEAKAGKKVILVREETKPEDIHGFFVSQGILTSRGGKTSHAAVVARGMGKCCVSGAEEIHIDVHAKIAKVGEQIIKEGDIITISGTTGDVYLGAAPLIDPEVSGDFGTILSWTDEFRRLQVRANADTPEGAKKAREFGAQGIGLVRTERMFNAVDRLPIVVEMIMADTLEERKAQLNRLLPLQRQDFIDIFTVMSPLPVTVRLLDPPLHEFLPTLEVVLREIYELKLAGKESEIAPKEKILKKIKELMEVNPMIGHRGIRLGITNPEIYEMQIRALIEAGAQCIKDGKDIKFEIMLPNVTDVNELIFMREKVVTPIVAQVEKETGIKVPFLYGSMVECVRAALTAAKLAKEAEFFSFGTNDLTQGTFSYSREDVEQKFIPQYVEKKILAANPFEILDREGVGRVMDIAVKEGRNTRPKLKVGICGEHGGEPSSIEWCHIIGLDYVSCSAFRIPVARLAAAHAAINNKKQ